MCSLRHPSWFFNTLLARCNQHWHTDVCLHGNGRPTPVLKEKTEDEHIRLMIKLGRYRQVEAALDENVVSVQSFYGAQQRTLLHTACSHGQRRIAKLLLRAHSDLNAMDCQHITPLQVPASIFNSVVVVRSIIALKQNIFFCRFWCPFCSLHDHYF